jgi:hypothetical protein
MKPNLNAYSHCRGAAKNPQPGRRRHSSVRPYPGQGARDDRSTVRESLIRVGNEEYAKENYSFGLTTMRNRHAEINGSMVKFDFRGKSSKQHLVEVLDRRVARIIRKCQDLPGQHLFEYQNEKGEICPIASEDVNAYLQSIIQKGRRLRLPPRLESFGGV